MKNKILKLIRLTVWLVFCLLVGVLFFKGIRLLANSYKSAKNIDISVSVFTEKGHDYLLVNTKYSACVIHAESCPCHKKK